MGENKEIRTDTLVSMARSLKWSVGTEGRFTVITAPDGRGDIRFDKWNISSADRKRIRRAAESTGLVKDYATWEKEQKDKIIQGAREQYADRIGTARQEAQAAPTTTSTPLTCSDCGKSGFKTPQAFSSHRRRSHGIIGQSESSLRRRGLKGAKGTEVAVTSKPSPPAPQQPTPRPVVVKQMERIPAADSAKPLAAGDSTRLDGVKAAWEMLSEEVGRLVKEADADTRVAVLQQELDETRKQLGRAEEELVELRAFREKFKQLAAGLS